MTSLVLGVVGAAIGFMVGGPAGAQIGFLAGSLIGSLIDPPKSQGPRLGDLKLQTSTYGKVIPIFWGSGRLGGNIIDQTDLEEHKEKSGGKGGPVVTNYTYSASFAISLGAARRFDEDVIKGILRIWADGRLIWSVDDGTEIPCTVYTGSEDQLPDPTFEAIHGVGEVPAYRGQAYVVFTDYYLTDFGNRIPSFEFEVFTGAGDYPYWIAHGNPWHQLNTNVPSFTINDDGNLVVLHTTGTPAINAYFQVFDVDTLTQIGSTVFSTTTYGQYGNAINSLTYPTQGGGIYQWAAPDMITGTMVDGADVSSTAPFVPSTFGGNLAVAINTRTTGAGYYSMSGVSAGLAYVNKYYEGGSYVGAYGLGGSYVAGDCALGVDAEQEKIYVLYNGTGPNLAELWRFDSDLTLEKHWTHSELAGTRLTSGGGQNFVVYKNQICFQQLNGGIYYATLIDISSSDVLTDSSVAPFLLDASGRFAYLGSGRVVVQGGGIFSLNPPPAAVLLSQIVGDLTDMTPLTAYDADDLYDEVRWFVIGNQMIVRNALQVLRSCFFFDAVESDDSVKFVRRDAFSESPARTIHTIPDDDLDARGYGEAPGSLLKTVRKKEQDLPRSVAMNYIDVDTDYQTGSQSTPRQTTLSQQDVTIDVPVGFNADEALQKCWALLTAEWVERESFEWSTTRKWAKLQPCDLVYVRGRVIRILAVTESPNGVLKFSGVLAAPSLYTSSVASLYYQIAPGAPADGFVPPTPPGEKVATDMVLLDLPLIDDSDYPIGFYIAVAKAAEGSWTGASVYKSSDGGTTYTEIATSTIQDVIGTVASALGDFGGGNIFDESNIITVTLTDDSTLSSASELAVLNGANLCCIGDPATGWEVLQYKTATLVSTDTWELSGLLRGRKGTEWMMPLHASNETFVALPTSINVNAPTFEMNLSRKYKAVSYGLTLAGATAEDFTNKGVAAKPYSPVQVGGGRDASGNITINLVRRTRIGGAWLDYVDVPLSETTEYYRIFIYSNSSYTTLVRQIFSFTQTGMSYLAADQTADFGSPQATLYIEAVQGGTYGDGYATRAAI